MLKEEIKTSKIQVLEKSMGKVDCIGLVLSVNTTEVEKTMINSICEDVTVHGGSGAKSYGIKELDAFIIQPKFKPQSPSELDGVECRAIFDLRKVKNESEKSIKVPKSDFNFNNIINVSTNYNNIEINENFRRKFEPIMLEENLILKRPRDKKNGSIVNHLLYLEIDFTALMTKFLKADDTSIGDLNFAILSARRGRDNGYDLTVIKCLRGERGNIVSNKNYENLKFY